MNILDKLSNLQTQKDNLIREYRSIQGEYKQYITDKSIPLMERWHVYISAPSELKIQYGCIKDFKSTALSFIFNIDNMNRHERIYIADNMAEIIYEGKLYPEEIYTDDAPDITEEQLIDAMEELLQENLEYFEFDW